MTAARRTDGPFLSIIDAAAGHRDLEKFLITERAEIDERLPGCGALLFRGFSVFDVKSFERAMNVLTPDRLPYTYRSSPRSSVGERVFSSTEYPSQQSIALHNENAFQREWPLKIAFCCLLPARSGGETPIGSVRKITSRIPASIVDAFATRGVQYVRHYREYVDLPWQTVFQLNNSYELADFCEKNGIVHEWIDEETLRTSQVCQGVAHHPLTHERLWFNQATMFHVSSLDADSEKSLVACFGRDRLPRQAFYGDGGEISTEDLNVVREAFEAEEFVFPWKTGDVLLLDNMLVAHGRRPYKGERKVITAMLDSSAHAKPESQSGLASETPSSSERLNVG